MNRKVLIGLFLAAAMLSLIPLTATQVTADAAAPAIFPDTIQENMELRYKVTEFETASGGSSGSVAVGYDAGHTFQGYNKTLAVNDVVYIKVDTREDAWEAETGDSSLIYSGWDLYPTVWGPECNVTLFPGGTAPTVWADYELDPAFSRMMIFPSAQLLVYPPEDGQDHSATMVPMFGEYDDNGTIHTGTWSGSGYTLHSDVNYDENSTYYMYLDGLGLNQLQYLKIPSTFTTESGKLMAHWNYSYGDYGYTYFNSGYVRWTSWAYADGLWPFPPFAKVVTDVESGITQSVEFYFGDDSAWKTDISWEWGASHPFLTQCRKLKLELESVSYRATPGFEVAFVFVGISIAAIAVLMSRKRK